MKLIKISDTRWIAADEISGVRINSEADTVIVRTKDGVGHIVCADYKKSIYHTADRLVSEIDAALASPTESTP